MFFQKDFLGVVSFTLDDLKKFSQNKNVSIFRRVLLVPCIIMFKVSISSCYPSVFEVTVSWVMFVSFSACRHRAGLSYKERRRAGFKFCLPSSQTQ